MSSREKGPNPQERKMFGGLFLARLKRMSEQKALYGPELTVDTKKLVERAIYSTYMDASRLGLRAEAREILNFA